MFFRVVLSFSRVFIQNLIFLSSFIIFELYFKFNLSSPSVVLWVSMCGLVSPPIQTFIFLPSPICIHLSISPPFPHPLSLHIHTQTGTFVCVLYPTSPSVGQSFRRAGTPRWSSASLHAFKQNSAGGRSRHTFSHFLC